MGACQSPLTTHMPDDAALELDPVWFEFEPPWTDDDLPTLPDTPDALPVPDTVQGVPDEIPPDPLADLPPADLPPADLPSTDLPGMPEPGAERAPTTVTPEPATPAAPLPEVPRPGRGGPRVVPGEAGRPAPPRWDPSMDRKVDRKVWESGERGPQAPTQPKPDEATGTPDAPADDLDPLRPPAGEAPVPTLPTLPDGPAAPVIPATPDVDPSLAPADDGNRVPPVTPVTPVAPPADDLGMPPGGTPAAPLGPTPSAPTPSTPAAPTAPAAPDGLEEDPFAPSAPTGPGSTPAVPAMPTVPTLPQPGAKPTADVEDDVWSGTGAAKPTLPGAPGTDRLPKMPAVPEAGAGDDPFAPGGAPQTPGAPTWRSADPEERAQEQATRLIDDPGNPQNAGYPSDILMLADAWVALREGPRPLVVVLYDNAARTSDLMAAEVLPVLAAHHKDIDIVAIDRGEGAEINEYERQVVRKLLGGDDESVPVLVAQSKDRRTLLARFGPFPGDELDRVLQTGKAAAPREAAPTPVVPDTPAAPAAADENPFAPRAPVIPTAPPEDPQPTAPQDTPDDDLPPTGMPTNPFGPEPGPRTPRAPTPAEPRVPSVPRVPEVPTPPADDGDAGERESPTFSVPKNEAARRHAARLRESPRNDKLGGYPTRLLSRARPGIALQPGHRPVVIVFYDDTSRASNLQAADILPTLVEAQARADIVVIDVAKGAERTEAEGRVVKPYYPGSVPALVVLSAARAPVKLWFQRTSARALRAAIDQAARVR
ncbi:MAG: hypothetical protein QNJ98_04165 [Planctomycetota bacterium]|nr:hypothetical protein [Planctomycetota bacterium]